MIIRKAEKSDIETICSKYDNMYAILQGYGFPYKINDQVLPEIVEVLVKSKFCYFAVAVEDDNIVGFVSASINKLDRKLSSDDEKNVGIINDIYVDEKYRGQNLAQTLSQNAEDWLKDAGVKYVRAEVVEGNEPAYKFWTKHGYTPLYTSVTKKLD